MSDEQDMGVSYADAGVSLDAGYEAVERYEEAVAATHGPGVIGGFGGFGGLFSLRDAAVSLDDPVLVSATDGVGTKLRLAFELGVHHTIGQDCVAMCVNDVAAMGARPLFFLDYLATGKLDPLQAADVVRGIAGACAACDCSLLGGETAEMPGFYADGEYDVAGFCVGVADRQELFEPGTAQLGDALIGLRSSGFHSNGFSLIRRIIADRGLDLADAFGGSTLGEELLEPTVLYPAAFAALRAESLSPRAAAHITGGGFYENLPRALGEGRGAAIRRSWQIPPIIEHIADLGQVAKRERWSVFNMGIGMVLVVDPDRAAASIATLNQAGFAAVRIGEVDDGPVRIAGID